MPSTLRIPLAARALGDALFPEVAVDDRHAAAALATIGDDGSRWLADRPTVYGVLARTRIFRRLAEDFFVRQPAAHGANLGCGLADYFQWLDSGHNHWLDADLPEVMALRALLLPAPHGRLRAAELDLSRPGWWRALDLPTRTPLHAICEGVLMYLEPAQVAGVFAELAEHAAPGSEFVFDAMCWLAVGKAQMSPSVRHTAAQFLWGPRRLREVIEPHPRLSIVSEHGVMEGYGWPYVWAGPLVRWTMGVPIYGVTRIAVGP